MTRVIPINNVGVSGTPASISSINNPSAATKKVRLMKGALSSTAAQTLVFTDGSGGPTMFAVFLPANAAPALLDFGKDGIVSATAGNGVFVTGSSGNISGYLVSDEDQ